MKSYRVCKVREAARQLSACPPRQRQYPSSLRGLKGKKVSCFQTLRPFFMCGSTRTGEISSRWKTSTNCNEGSQTMNYVWWGWAWSTYFGLFRSHHWGLRILVGHWFCHLLGNQMLLGPVCIAQFANPPDFGKIEKFYIILTKHIFGTVQESSLAVHYLGEGHTDFAIIWARSSIHSLPIFQ